MNDSKKEKKGRDIVSFSGGKDSTAMLLLMIEKGYNIDEIVFFDTGWEFPEMYDHIKKVEEYTGLKVTYLHPDKPFDYWMFDHVKTKGKNKGQKGYSWPDFRNRWCTALKRETINKYLKTTGKHTQYVGIVFDEQHRPLNENKRYVLIEEQMTEKEALQYCYDLGFDWSGLYELFDRVSCYNCPLSRIGELKNVHDYKPELWAKMQDYDNRTYRQFRSDYSIEQLNCKFKP